MHPQPGSVLASIALVMALFQAHDHPHAPSGPAYQGPRVELVETIPVETRLGDPKLPSAAKVWVEMIDAARVTIELEHFYLSHWPGEPTGPVLDALGRAARRGVAVRMILDQRFHATYAQPAESLGALPGIRVRWIDMKNVSGGGVQHGKWMTVDGQQTFVGSQNFDWRALSHIHELGVRVRDARVTGLYQRVFEADWISAVPGAVPARQNHPRMKTAISMLPLSIAQAPGDSLLLWPSFSPLGSIPDSSLWDLTALLRLLDEARSEVVAQMLTYGSGRGADRDSTLDLAVRRAAARGVKVKLLVSDWEADNPRIRDLQRLSGVPNVEIKLSSVPDWSGGYIPFARVEHCKYLVADSIWTWVGTSNWEPDYFRTSRNAAVSIRYRPIALQARGIFETGWSSPTAKVVRQGETYTPRIHGDKPPEGAKTYGR
ncbi:MAG TPA: phospholipase D-like domain-containing protein [Candidatus Eisenbacteria bacterium]|nr:phospholipase D-like domain-containing protein [Candidatus Eisenbacteria bacterium]